MIEIKEKEGNGCYICMMVVAFIVVVYIVIFELIPRVIL